MGLCKKQKKVRPPLKPRQGPYKKVNAYTSKLSCEQVITFLLGISVIILHSIFNIAAIRKIDHPILYIMLALTYVLVLCIIYVYIKITVFDPVDRYIITPNLAEAENFSKKQNNIQYCNLCRSYIHKKSYHCKRCNRCTQNFDHHCVFLNNCIGSLNYELFLSLLLLYILFLLNIVGQSIWVFVVARQDIQVSKASITEWMSIAIIVYCFFQFIATIALLGFHCYISCCLDLTTIAFYQSDSQSKKSDTYGESKKIQPMFNNQSPNLFLQSSQLQNTNSHIK